jgi:hypothetical protein
MNNKSQKSPGKAEVLEFRLGPFGSFVPFLSFLSLVIICIYFGVTTITFLLLCILIGLIVGMTFAKNIYKYCEAIFEGMTSKLGGVAVVCWLYAGLYGGILRSAKLAEGLIWLGHGTGLTGGFFVTFIFMACAFYATGCGTGIGNDFRLHPYRRANLMDAISNSFVYAVPWSAPMPAIIATIGMTSFSYPFIPTLN